MRVKLRVVLLAASLILLTCMTTAGQTPGGADEAVQREWAQYEQAVRDSATYRPENVLPLKPLTFDETTFSAKVVALTDFDYHRGWQFIPVDVWVTAVPEVQDKCRGFDGTGLELRLKQLLGLQPTAKIVSFVTIQVGPADIFRPTVNPTPTSSLPCDNTGKEKYCGASFPKWVGNEYKAWVSDRMVSSYLVSNAHDRAYSYPWTRLGYTYDWIDTAPEKSHYGASEYVIRAGSVVNVTAIESYTQYCSRPDGLPK